MAWTRLADMPAGRDYPQAAFLDGKLYVAGGWDTSDSGLTDTMEVYDPATDTWSAGPKLPTAVAAAGVAVLDNRMYVIGGCPSFNNCGTAAVQVYDPALDRWEQAASYPQPVSFEGCGAIAGKLYCAGGTGDQTGATRNGYVYDPGTDTWSPIAGLPAGDQWAAASTAAGGKLLLVGGVIDGSSLITNQGWAYDPVANAWSQLPNANTIAWRAAGACGFYKVGGAGLVPALSNAEMLPGYGDCATAGTVSWLAVKPAQATTLAPGATLTATVSLDASRGIDQPGTYYAGLSLSEDTPYPFTSIPVTMTVNPPSSWGKLAGTVSGVTCAGATIALGGATISVTGTTQTFTLKTDAAGSYQLWLDVANNPLSLVVGKNGWAPTGRSRVKLVKGKTTTVDFTLQPVPACRLDGSTPGVHRVHLDGRCCRLGGRPCPDVQHEQQGQRGHGGDAFGPGAQRLLRVPDVLVHVRERAERPDVDVAVEQHGRRPARGDQEGERRGVATRANQQGNAGNQRDDRLRLEQEAFTQRAGLVAGVPGRQVEMHVHIDRQAREYHDGKHDAKRQPASSIHHNHRFYRAVRPGQDASTKRTLLTGNTSPRPGRFSERRRIWICGCCARAVGASSGQRSARHPGGLGWRAGTWGSRASGCRAAAAWGSGGGRVGSEDPWPI